ncbi:MAG: hypothetical protein ACXWPM_02500 [Bdellovibrionota bacterium]
MRSLNDALLNQKGAGPFFVIILFLFPTPARADGGGGVGPVCRPLYQLARAMMAARTPKALREAVFELVHGHMWQEMERWYADGFEAYLKGKAAGQSMEQILAARDATIFMKELDHLEGVYARRIPELEQATTRNLIQRVPKDLVDKQLATAKATLRRIREIRARGKVNYLELLEVTGEHPTIMEDPIADRGKMLSHYFENAKARLAQELEDFPFEIWLPMHEDPGVLFLNRTGPLGLHVEGLSEFPRNVDGSQQTTAFFTEHDRFHARRRMIVNRMRSARPSTPQEFARWLLEKDAHLERYRRFETWVDSNPDPQSRDILHLLWKEADRERLFEPYADFASLSGRFERMGQLQTAGLENASLDDALKAKLSSREELANIHPPHDLPMLRAKVDRAWKQLRGYISSMR